MWFHLVPVLLENNHLIRSLPAPLCAPTLCEEHFFQIINPVLALFESLLALSFHASRPLEDKHPAVNAVTSVQLPPLSVSHPFQAWILCSPLSGFCLHDSLLPHCTIVAACWSSVPFWISPSCFAAALRSVFLECFPVFPFHQALILLGLLLLLECQHAPLWSKVEILHVYIPCAVEVWLRKVFVDCHALFWVTIRSVLINCLALLIMEINTIHVTRRAVLKVKLKTVQSLAVQYCKWKTTQFMSLAAKYWKWMSEQVMVMSLAMRLFSQHFVGKHDDVKKLRRSKSFWQSMMRTVLLFHSTVGFIMQERSLWNTQQTKRVAPCMTLAMYSLCSICVGGWHSWAEVRQKNCGAIQGTQQIFSRLNLCGWSCWREAQQGDCEFTTHC